MLIKCLEEFFGGLDLPEVSWDLIDDCGIAHQISNADVRDHIATMGADEQIIIAKSLRRIAFETANINLVLKHLADEIINDRTGRAA